MADSIEAGLLQLTTNFALAPPPFRLQADPAEAFAHPSWRQARAQALAALNRGQSVMVLGRAGTGKTLLLQSSGGKSAHRRQARRRLRRGDGGRGRGAGG